MKKYSGFTLVELMITITVIAIVTAIALPSFDDTIRRNRAASIANTLLASLAFARSEASTRGVSTQTGPINGANWADGWQITIDGNNDGDFVDGPAIDTVLKVYDGISNNSTLTLDTNAFNGFIQFQPSGRLVFPAGNPTAAQITYRANQNCGVGSGRNYKRIILISPGGIARISTDTAC